MAKKNPSGNKTKTNFLMFFCIAIGAIVGLSLSRGAFSISAKTGNLFSIICVALLAIFVIFAIWVVISSKKKTPKASKIENQEAKKFLPVADKGVVYIFRDQFVGMAKALPIVLSEKQIGYVKGKYFLRFELPEGGYTHVELESTKEVRARIKRCCLIKAL